jgi:hypothetical protein
MECQGTCQIQWTEPGSEQLTPDANPAIGYASIRGEDFLICAEHRKRMPKESKDGWSFTPFSDLAL